MNPEKDTKSHPYKIYRRRFVHIAAETIVVIAILMALATGFMVWRLSLGPMDLGFAREYIESALYDPDTGRRASVDRVVLSWPEMRGPLLLGLQGSRVINEKGKVIISVDEIGVTLSRRRLLVGKIAPTGLYISKPQLKIVRATDGTMDIGLGSRKEEVPEEGSNQIKEQTQITAQLLQYIARPGVERGKRSPLATLRRLEVREARVMIEDHVGGVSWYLPRFDIAFESVREGLAAAAYVELPGGREKDSRVRVDLLHGWESKDTAVQATIENFDTRILAGKMSGLTALQEQDIVFNGKLEMLFGPDFMPKEGYVEVISPQGGFFSSDVREEAVPYQDFYIKASYDGTRKKLDIPKASVTLNGTTIRAQGAVTHTDTEASGPLKIVIDDVTEAQIDALWPASLKGDSSEEWIVHKITAGTFHDLSADMNLAFLKTAQGWDFSAQHVLASFAFDGATVNYREPMLPVTEAKGRGTFDLDQEKLDISIESAKISDLNVTDAQLEFVNIIQEGKGVADINVKLSGPVRTGIEYVEKEPIKMEHDFDLTQVKGNANLNVNIAFPTVADIKIADVKVNVTGTLSDVVLPDVVKDLDLTEGPFEIAVKGNEFNLKGKGALEGRPATLEYVEFLSSEGQKHKNTVKATISADDELRTRLGIDLTKFLEGTVPVNVSYTEFQNGRSEAMIAADVTPARVFIDAFDYEKAPGIEGAATMKAVLQDGELKEISDLVASAPNLKIENTYLAFRGVGPETELAKGTSSRFVINESVGKLEFSVDQNDKIIMALSGPFLDLRPFMDNEKVDPNKPYDEPAMAISVAMDAMRTADEQTVQYGKAFIDIDRAGSFNALEFDANVGSGEIYLRYKPDESGKRVFRLEADDAGAALKAFGLYKTMIGGKLSVYGEPVGGVQDDRNLKGKAEITNFRVVKAPALAKLLGAMSLPGMNDLMGNDGLAFTKLESDFDWLYRPEGGVIVLKDGRTSGNSLGLTFDGKFDKTNDVMDVSGTMVPLSGINKIIGNIPLIGNIITGGTGSLFAATYSMKGSMQNPQVFVNPLSVLTPGILRRILFEN
jgi:hypothetical protein